MNSKKSVKGGPSIVQSSKAAAEFMRLATVNAKKSSAPPRKTSAISKTSAEIKKEDTIRKNFGISVQEYEKLSYTNVDKLFELNAKMLKLSLKK
jgi:hypothetical protein